MMFWWQHVAIMKSKCSESGKISFFFTLLLVPILLQKRHACIEISCIYLSFTYVFYNNLIL